MQSFWKSKGGVLDMIRVLAYMVKEYNKDKIDMWTTVSEKHFRSNNFTTLREELEPITPTGTTNIDSSLGYILRDYEGKLRKAGVFQRDPGLLGSKVKPMSLYVLTDAVWEQHSDARQPIEFLNDTMKELCYPQSHVGIQFVQFGDNPASIERLQELDHAEGLAMCVDSLRCLTVRSASKFYLLTWHHLGTWLTLLWLPATS